MPLEQQVPDDDRPQLVPAEEQAATFQLPAEAEAELVVAGLYNRQATLNLHTEQHVAVIGCGGVGVWAALALALGGITHLTLFDSDTISLHNLNRLPFDAASVGMGKSDALASWLQFLRPDCEIMARGNFEPLLHTEWLSRVDWVVCCTDSLKSRQLAYKAAQECNCWYLELGADGERWTLSATPPQFTTELEAEAGYAIVPIHVGPCMMAGAAAAYYVLHNTLPDGDYLAEWQRTPQGDESLHMQHNEAAKSWDEVMAAGLDEEITEVDDTAIPEHVLNRLDAAVEATRPMEADEDE